MNRLRFPLTVIVGLCAGSLAGVATSAAPAGRLACKPYGTLTGTTVHFCGPAIATLSAFPGVTFKGGTCSTKPSGSVVFTLKIGTRTQDAARNSGLPYFGLIVSGSLSHPTGGGVTAYSKGKLWGGAGTSFRGTATSGSFTAAGINGSRGTATGTYHC